MYPFDPSMSSLFTVCFCDIYILNLFIDKKIQRMVEVKKTVHQKLDSCHVHDHELFEL